MEIFPPLENETEDMNSEALLLRSYAHRAANPHAGNNLMPSLHQRIGRAITYLQKVVVVYHLH
jgi:hypothetical protein